MNMKFTFECAMDVAVEAAVVAGKILNEMLETATVHEKAPKDLVTDADVASQAAIESRIHTAFPDHHFVGEETGRSIHENSFANDSWTWVVDPLDGTTNYVHRLPNYAVSIALLHGADPVVGVVYDPVANELFQATRGMGAKRNGQVIRASRCDDLEKAMVAASFPPKLERDSKEIAQFIEVLLQSQSIRRLGSAALNLCYVSCGRLDAYWANQLKAWDIAAGTLIATESGAVLSGIHQESFHIARGEILVAASHSLLVQMRNCLGTVKN